jgi:transposase-like protein
MPKTKARRFSQDFKVAAVERMLAGDNVSALARTLKVKRKLLYAWRDRHRTGGPDALRGVGRPVGSRCVRKSVAKGELAQAQARIAELERKIGQQQVELDFFQRALRQVDGLRRTSGRGGPGSTGSSK